MPTRPDRHARSDRPRRPRIIGAAASAVLLAALLGSEATAAHASEAAPAASATREATAALAEENPKISGTITGEFETGTGRPVGLGSTVRWTARLTNSGDVPLRGVHLGDLLGGADLPVGGTVTLTTQTTVGEDDLQTGAVIVLIEASGTTRQGVTVSKSLNGGLTLPGEHPHLSGELTGVFEQVPVVPGTVVTWTVPVTNTGDVPLRFVHLGDLLGGADLAVGETAVMSVQSTVTQEDLNRGSAGLATEVSGLSPKDFRVVHRLSGTLPIPKTPVVPAVPLTPATTVRPAVPLEPSTPVQPAVPVQPSSTVVPAKAVSRTAALADTGSAATAVLPLSALLLLAGAALLLATRRRTA
ncbi:LPXTG cell wall anchor domain-containing protein [Rathayibacter sp. VKM Ac-2927]|uniref:DUF7507 domain-containing protein n=1 Tax=Rathayibacter sp. VKM Ac-2927 TaxID=2929478 RepID=UPI001FB40EE6|nr:LPXTG cell wall anchor domain-containing protein [Rathayibacter sp. VKM Ac-2927]MCJ1689396.1 LPXTG cell wall anchor domain-containing protein [Rathayibacter sp. VKM Ac-2927]